MIFYNGFNLLVDILVATGAGIFFYNVGFRAGYHERDIEIEVERDMWQDYYLDSKGE